MGLSLENTTCDLNDEILAANPEQLTQRSRGDVLIHILRTDTNKPRHCNLIIVMTPVILSNSRTLRRPRDEEPFHMHSACYSL